MKPPENLYFNYLIRLFNSRDDTTTQRFLKSFPNYRKVFEFSNIIQDSKNNFTDIKFILSATRLIRSDQPQHSANTSVGVVRNEHLKIRYCKYEFARLCLSGYASRGPEIQHRYLYLNYHIVLLILKIVSLAYGPMSKFVKQCLTYLHDILFPF
jgi:hypothetical protein